MPGNFKRIGVGKVGEGLLLYYRLLKKKMSHCPMSKRVSTDPDGVGSVPYRAGNTEQTEFKVQTCRAGNICRSVAQS